MHNASLSVYLKRVSFGDFAYVITARSQSYDVVREKLSGIEGYVVNSFDISCLLEKIEIICEFRNAALS